MNHGYFDCGKNPNTPLDWSLYAGINIVQVLGSPVYSCGIFSSFTELVQFLPLLRDMEFIQDIHRDLVNEETEWANVGIRDVMRFAWAITLRNLAQQPEMQGNYGVFFSLISRIRPLALSSAMEYCTQYHHYQPELSWLDQTPTWNHKRQNKFQSRGAKFLKFKMVIKTGALAPAIAWGCLRGDVPPSEVGAFLKM